jgi:heptosyltransferase I
MPAIPLLRPDIHIAIVRFSALGDVVMVSAAVCALRKRFPNATITWITSPLSHSLLEGLEGVHFEIAEKPRSLADYRAFYRRFRPQRFDVVLAMQANLRINLLYPALRAPIKLGFDRVRAREGQELFCNRRIPFRDDEHLVDSFLSFVETLSGTPATALWNLPISENDLAWAREKLQAIPRPWVAIHPHTSKAERNWLPDRYAAVMQEAIARWRCGIVLTGGDADAEHRQCEQLAQLATERTLLNLCGQTTPKQLAALLSLVDVLVAPDTGSVHIARAMNTPVIGLYAVAPATLTGPHQRMEYCVDRYPQATQRFLGKTPEQLRWNTRVHRPEAMALIEVADVMQQLEKILEPRAPERHT